MKHVIQVRPATPEDKPAVLAFCQSTFEWGDYIPQVWHDWQSDANGRLLVATLDRRPVGLLHVAMLEPDCWMEGMRVHPDYRRHGVGGRMDVAGRQFARERGASLARLATSIKNAPAQAMLAKEGYHPLAQFNIWTADPSMAGDWITPGTSLDADEILDVWKQSAVRGAGANLLPDEHWKWRPLDATRIQRHMKASQIRSLDSAFSICTSHDEEGWSEMTMLGIAGEAHAVESLARSAAAEAAYRGYGQIEAMVAEYPPLNATLEHVGYKKNSAMLIYEQSL